MPDIDIKEASQAHAEELNKSISKGLTELATNLFFGLAFIGVALFLKR